jgi:predicted dehydrogenase
MMLRLGLIGAGYWGEKLVRVFESLHPGSIRTVVDRDPAARSRIDSGMRFTERAADVWTDPEIDAVLVATPPSTHDTLAREALHAGKHCWVEKPLALQVADAEELVRLAESNGRTLFVDETFLYDPLVRKARDWIRTGRLGRLHHVSLERLGMGRIRRDSDVWWNSAPHDLAILRYLVPAEVLSIEVERFAHLQPGIADICVGTLRLAGDISGHIHVSWISPVKTATCVVIGSRGMLRYEGRFGERALTLFDYRIDDPSSAHSNVVPIHDFTVIERLDGGSEEPLALAAEAFVAAIRDGTPTPSDGRRSLEVVKLLSAANPPTRRAAAMRLVVDNGPSG